MKKLLLVLSVFLVLGGCTKADDKEKGHVSKPEGEIVHPIATITMNTGESIVLELYPEHAPNTVYNFIALANKGFYDGTMFHRVIPGFMIQGGDPEGTGMGGPGYGIMGEFESNNFENELSHERGVISMARSQSPDSAGSQFFIMHQYASHLDGQYASFGKVIENIELVDVIANVETAAQDRPVDTSLTVIKSITVDTKGVTYPEPRTID